MSEPRLFKTLHFKVVCYTEIDNQKSAVRLLCESHSTREAYRGILEVILKLRQEAWLKFDQNCQGKSISCKKKIGMLDSEAHREEYKISFWLEN